MIAALVEQVTVMISGNSNVIVYHKVIVMTAVSGKQLSSLVMISVIVYYKVIVMTAVSRNDTYYLALL